MSSDELFDADDLNHPTSTARLNGRKGFFFIFVGLGFGIDIAISPPLHIKLLASRGQVVSWRFGIGLGLRLFPTDFYLR